jgi:hypothetical protein
VDDWFGTVRKRGWHNKTEQKKLYNMKGSIRRSAKDGRGVGCHCSNILPCSNSLGNCLHRTSCLISGHRWNIPTNKQTKRNQCMFRLHLCARGYDWLISWVSHHGCPQPWVASHLGS